MKVQELRQLLKGADRKQLEKAFVECYKSITKLRKEELDPMITDILQGNEVKKKEKTENVAFPSLENEILEFIDNAEAQYYLRPNRVVSKSQRSKWRFLVKRYIKEGLSLFHVGKT